MRAVDHRIWAKRLGVGRDEKSSEPRDNGKEGHEDAESPCKAEHCLLPAQSKLLADSGTPQGRRKGMQLGGRKGELVLGREPRTVMRLTLMLSPSQSQDSFRGDGRGKQID